MEGCRLATSVVRLMAPSLRLLSSRLLGLVLPDVPSLLMQRNVSTCLSHSQEPRRVATVLPYVHRSFPGVSIYFLRIHRRTTCRSRRRICGWSPHNSKLQDVAVAYLSWKLFFASGFANWNLIKKKPVLF